MKAIHSVIFIALVLSAQIALAQTEAEVNTADSTGLPGDHFSLQGALDLFKYSSSLEDFEKKLNMEDNAVNNLDLNGDGDIDYIRVLDNSKDSAHAIVLQVPISETESQDVAVIELEKKGKQSAGIQIVGDEDLYGENSIVEPFEEKEVMEDGKNHKGPSAPLLMTPVRLVVNVWMWPCVSYIYAPAYVVWVSPWRWHSYPMWWRPWHPHPWRWHYVHCVHYYAFYHPVRMHRMMAARMVYSQHRRTSAMVSARYKVAHDNYNAKKMNAGARNNRAAKTEKRQATKHADVRSQKQGQKAKKDVVKPRGKTAMGKKGGGGRRK